MARRKKADKDETVIADYIKSKKKDACMLVDRIMKELADEERISAAPVNQLSSVMGTLLDKFGAGEKEKSAEGTLAEIFGDFEDVK